MPTALVLILSIKIDQDAALIEDMLAMVPAEKQHWSPDWPATNNDPPYDATRLSAHLVESMAGLCACFPRLHPQSLDHFNTFKSRISSTPNPTIAESRLLLAACRTLIAEGFSHTTDEQLAQLIPTYFSPQGEAFMSVLLDNLKHINHHAHQLFLYLKLIGIPVSTRHLYHFKAKPE